MRKFILSLALSVFCVFTYAQKAAKFSDEMKKEMQQKVVEAARHGWEGYKKYAWGQDDLRPLTKTHRNWYNAPMLMTPVDAFDTFVMLGMEKEAKEAKELIFSTLKFDVDNDVQLFEVTIRILGGLISAYELDGDKRFLTLAIDLADRLMPAFKTPTHMPYRYVHLQTGKVRNSINNPAEIGTLLLEFGQLSKHTGDPTYLNASRKAIMEVYKRRSKIGLVGERIDVISGEWKNSESHISGYIDSYYEYLYKGGLLFNDKELMKAFELHNKAIKKYLINKTENGWFLQQVDMHTGKIISTKYGALDAFYAGLCSLAGDDETATEIQRANYYMWTNFNMEPELFDFKTDSVLSPYYILRPENIESAFYLYRGTGQADYLWQGKTMVEDIIKNCKTEAGFASIKDVATLEKTNSMESFFFAETLKYAWLLFAPESSLDLKRSVFNTEAHPYKIKIK